ncbi:MAG: hypothetical protein GY861_05870 [bacterium]|nr:hypothetical protein [bacterium]
MGSQLLEGQGIVTELYIDGTLDNGAMDKAMVALGHSYFSSYRNPKNETPHSCSTKLYAYLRDSEHASRTIVEHFHCEDQNFHRVQWDMGQSKFSLKIKEA